MDLVYNGKKENYNLTLILEAKTDDRIKLPENDIIKTGDIIKVPDSRKDLIKRLLISGFAKVVKSKKNKAKGSD